MRAAPSSLLVLGLASLACTINNPGFFVTDGASGSGTDATTGDASTTGRTTTDATTSPTSTTPATSTSTASTTVDPSATGTTESLTGGTSSDTTDDPSTGDPGSTSSESDGSTSMVDLCPLPDAPEFDLGFGTDDPEFVCNFDDSYLFYAEPIGPDGPNAWKMRVCLSINECKAGDPCFSEETVRLVFDGPEEFVPKLDAAPCHQVGVLFRGADQNDPTVCRVRVLRLAHTGYDVPAVDYVGAVGVPDTTALPLAWPDVLGFGVLPQIVDQCEGEPVCEGLLPGVHKLILHWFPKSKEYGLDAGVSIGESYFAKKNGQMVELFGSFTNIASHAPPGGTCFDGLEFAWVYFGELLAGP